MAPFDLFVASLNFTRAESLSSGFHTLVVDRSLFLTWLQQVSETWSWHDWTEKGLEWLSRPGEQRYDTMSIHMTNI
ncbi:hypothetical protein N7513_003138 [Penicillium frequentans]|nr:hypothetical protein N7513_003138 [Penicillium glabrum]